MFGVSCSWVRWHFIKIDDETPESGLKRRINFKFLACAWEMEWKPYIFSFTINVPTKTSYKEFLWCHIVCTQCASEHWFLYIFSEIAWKSTFVQDFSYAEEGETRSVFLELQWGYPECHTTRVFNTVVVSWAQRNVRTLIFMYILYYY